MRVDRGKINVFLLAVCQALYGTSTSLMVATGPLVGHALAPDKVWATLPLAAHHAGVMTATLPASLLMRRIGRRPGFMLGAAVGVVGAAIAAQAILAGSFALFCLGVYVVGCANGFAVFYRFAAAETAPERFRAKAISLVRSPAACSRPSWGRKSPRRPRTCSRRCRSPAAMPACPASMSRPWRRSRSSRFRA